MSERQYQHTVSGQEVAQGELNLISENGALADDRLLADLLQFTRGNPNPQRGILPYSAAGGASDSNFSALVDSNGPTGSVDVYPFRAILGSRTSPSSGARLSHRDVRSVVFTDVGDTTVPEVVDLSATSSNHRVDLIYARVDVDLDEANVTRYKRETDNSLSALSISVVKATTVTLGVVQGSESASPSRPALPSDSGSSYYIPIAYIWIDHPFTSSSIVNRWQIEEVAPRLGWNHGRTGSADAGPCNKCYESGSALLSNSDWTVSKRPDAFLPPTMSGVVHRFFGLDQETDMTIPNSTSVVLDDSIDWRKRVFLTHAQARAGASYGLAWQVDQFSYGEMVPEDSYHGSCDEYSTMGQSFQDTLGGGSPYRGAVMTVTQADMAQVAASAQLRIFVDGSTGELKAETNGTAAGCKLFFWIMASGQFDMGGHTNMD